MGIFGGSRRNLAFLVGRIAKKNMMTRAEGVWRETIRLALGGGLGFWTANLTISLTPIAADYRAALSISYIPMQIEALLGGVIIGSCVGFALIRNFDRIPTNSPTSKSVILSGLALVLVTLLIALPSTFLSAADGALRYFLIGTAINALRILALGFTVGYLYERQHTRVVNADT